MNAANYLYISALLFTIGAVGVVVRRNAIVVFMCIELMLNAANLSFVQECTSYDLITICDDDEHDGYVLVDPYGDQDGDPFYDLDDVVDYVNNLS